MREPQEIDRWLDEALADYAAVEPRAGLDNRVLARLASEKQGAMPWWIFALSMATLALALVWLRPHLEVVPPPDVRWTVNLPPPLPIQRAPQPSEGNLPRVRLREAAPAKQERFPSPSPLTDQEKMLARFVQDFPERATLIARAQTELYKQDQEEMARPWLGKENN